MRLISPKFANCTQYHNILHLGRSRYSNLVPYRYWNRWDMGLASLNVIPTFWMLWSWLINTRRPKSVKGRAVRPMFGKRCPLPGCRWRPCPGTPVLLLHLLLLLLLLAASNNSHLPTNYASTHRALLPGRKSWSWQQRREIVNATSITLLLSHRSNYHLTQLLLGSERVLNNSKNFSQTQSITVASPRTEESEEYLLVKIDLKPDLSGNSW